MRIVLLALLASAVAGCGGMFAKPSPADTCGKPLARGEMLVESDKGFWYANVRGSTSFGNVGFIAWKERHASDDGYWWQQTDDAGRTLTGIVYRKHAPDGTHLFDLEQLVVSYTNIIEARRPADVRIVRINYLGLDGATMTELWDTRPGYTLKYEIYPERKCLVVGKPGGGDYRAGQFEGQPNRFSLSNGNAELYFHVPLDRRDGAGFLTEWGELGEVLARFDALGPEPGGGAARGKKERPGAIFE